MQIGMISLGRMGANIVHRLLKEDHQCVVFDKSSDTAGLLTQEGAIGASSLSDFVEKLLQPKIIGMMVPAALVEQVITDILPQLEPDDILVDGGNTYTTSTSCGVPRNLRPREFSLLCRCQQTEDHYEAATAR